MSIYEDIGISKELELRNLRTWKSKTFDYGRKRRYIIFTGPIHYFTQKGIGENLNIAEWDDIDIRLKLDDDNNNYLALKNKFTNGFRNDNKSYKFYGIRRDSNHQFEVTPIKVKLDDDEIEIPLIFKDKQLLDDYTFEHQILDDVSLWTNISTIGVRSAVKTNRWIYNFEISEIIHLKGFKIINKYNESNSVKEYIPESDNRFVFQSVDDPKDIIWIPQPKMWNDDGVINCGINHRLIERHNELIYIKYPTESGRDWLLCYKPTFYLDNTNYYGSTADGYVHHVDSVWDTVHDAGTGSDSSDNDSSYSIAIGANTTINKTVAYNIYRSFYYFDTSEIEGTVSSCKLYIYGVDNNSGDVSAQEGTQADTLTTADYDACNPNPSTGGGTFGYNQSWSTSSYNEIEFNALGISKINIDGTTKICCRNYTYDYLDSWVSLVKYAGGYYSEEAGKQPYLDIIAVGGVTPIKILRISNKRVCFIGKGKKIKVLS